MNVLAGMFVAVAAVSIGTSTLVGLLSVARYFWGGETTFSMRARLDRERETSNSLQPPHGY